MMDYWNDYYEPSEFDIAMMEFKQSIIDNVRKDIKEKIENLERENAELKEVKSNWEELKKEHKDALLKLQRKTESVEHEVLRRKAKDILKDITVIGYRPKAEYQKLPKCDKCDENRIIHFTSPMGRKMTEYCECAKKIPFYSPKQVKLQQFSVDDEKIFSLYYELDEGSFSDRYSSDKVYSELPKDLSELNTYCNVFLKEEDCKAYCDWLNNRGEDGE